MSEGIFHSIISISNTTINIVPSEVKLLLQAFCMDVCNGKLIALNMKMTDDKI